ncbi:MAG TPA: biopolymer transporter ExbD [Candidatus Limnocylindria bacterium]|nr:biopolymer transporter ExbD [Candidatus Limnocylindria bacterium]
MEGYRRKGRQRAAITDIPLTPLIDTALTLLIIFMVTAPMINNAIKVDLPKGKAKEDTAGKQQELVVFIDKDKGLFLNGTAVTTVDDLMSKIKAKVGQQADRMVCVKADKAVSYGQVIELVDHIKVVGGVSYVVLATKRA